MAEPFKNIHGHLVEKCKIGDRDAQFQIYKLYSKAMYNISLRITNDPDTAEDVLQDAFVSAFRNLESYQAKATFGAWLKRIVVNTAINQMNKKGISTVSMEETEVEVQDYEEESYPNQNYEVIRIKKAMELLPDGYRMVFSLYLLEGYDHKEIAEIMDITESTSKSQFNRAKNKIRSLLKEEVL